MKYSVLLLYPDYLAQDGGETYYAHVEADTPAAAARTAQREAASHNDLEAAQADDFLVELVIEGHQFGLDFSEPETPNPEPETADPTGPLKALIALQPPEVRDQLEVIPEERRPGCFTIALKNDHTSTAFASIEDIQSADLYFDLNQHCDEDGNLKPDGWWREGKPGVDNCNTVYRVGEFELDLPDGFNPLRYT